ncbi:unnamed protein product [marine sediment metagenome]|uniref:Uncharacterized protein n=1 Tax=marine sediment metagenome TaxID=412755 RepID=X1RXV5_9ZZZZ
MVYKDRPVNVDSSKAEHITNKELGQAKAKGQRASDDKLTNPNKAKSDPASSKLALEEEKSSNSGWFWLLGGLVTGVGVLVGWEYLAHKNGNNSAPLADPYAQFYQQFGASKQHKEIV